MTNQQILTNERAQYELVLIPEGLAVIGSGERERFSLGDEKPQFRIVLPAFYIGRYCVTNQQFVRFLNDVDPSGKDLSRWIDLGARSCRIRHVNNRYSYENEFKEHPVVCVSWYGAEAFCHCAGLRLPTELEWEFGARGTAGFIYPWGDDWNQEKCHHELSLQKSETCKVSDYRSGASPFGLYNMVGNVWEWTSDWYEPEVYHRYSRGDVTLPKKGSSKVLRGGAWPASIHRIGFRCALRNSFPPLPLSISTPGVGSLLMRLRGFRCALSP